MIRRQTDHPAARVSGRGWRELALVTLGFSALTVLLTYPLAVRLGSVGRIDNNDGQFSIWSIAWVARALVVDPLHVFDANIFYPHRGTLAYSESNLGAGALAIPVYWITGNAYAAHNFVFLLSFVLSATGMYYLARYLVADRRAASVAAIGFAYCPYVFSHTAHIWLLMTVGLPWSMLAFHRLADRSTPGRGAVLGLAMAAQALLCGYYALFVTLMVGFAVLVTPAMRHRWSDRRYWTAVAVAAVVAVLIVLPVFVPYLNLQRETGFHRPLGEARPYSADWRAYLASGSYAHAWLLTLLRRWKEVLFPGIVLSTFGISGLAFGWSAGGRLREVAIVYGGLTVLAVWASFGPDGGLYAALYSALPPFSLIRAPSRMGIVVTFALAALASVTIAAMLARIGQVAALKGRATPAGMLSSLAAVVLAAATVAELMTPVTFPAVPPVDPAYQVLAKLPDGAVLEMPVYSQRFAFVRARYMLSSTIHWKPLVNAYSDHIPREFIEKMGVLGGFPSLPAFELLERDRVRYVVFHLDLLGTEARADVRKRVKEFDRYLSPRYTDERTLLYEIIGFPS